MIKYYAGRNILALEKSNFHNHSIQDIPSFHTWSKKHCTMQILGRFLLGTSMSAPPEKHRSTSVVLADLRVGRCTVMSLVVNNNSIASAEYRIHFLKQSVVKKLFYLSNCQIGWRNCNERIVRKSGFFALKRLLNKYRDIGLRALQNMLQKLLHSLNSYWNWKKPYIYIYIATKFFVNTATN